jgi:alpha-N-arabinofuranosidase
MEMYNVHQDAKLLPITLKTSDYIVGKEKLPAVSASASVDANGATHISLVNIDAKNAQEVNIEFFGAAYKTVSGRVLTSGKLQDFNSFESPGKVNPVEFKGAKLKDNKLTATLPPYSVVVLELK